MQDPAEHTDDNSRKEEAIKAKSLGDEAYKKRKFDEALQHYDKAWELDSTNVTILTNKAGKYKISENEADQVC